MPISGGVLDASVLLAFIRGEIGADEAEEWFAGACISAVNLSEVVAKLADLGFEADIITTQLNRFDLDVRPFDQAQAEKAGLLRPSTRQWGLSFGDRACLSLAADLGRPAVTADRDWAELDIGIRIELIR